MEANPALRADMEADEENRDGLLNQLLLQRQILRNALMSVQRWAELPILSEYVKLREIAQDCDVALKRTENNG